METTTDTYYTSTIPPEQLHAIDAYWRAANCLSPDQNLLNPN